MLLAEQERFGGVAQHVSPFAGVGDIGNLLTRAKFAIPTVDIERVVVRYGDMFALLRDLRGLVSICVLFARAYDCLDFKIARAMMRLI